jgi:hypothetical protein
LRHSHACTSPISHPTTCPPLPVRISKNTSDTKTKTWMKIEPLNYMTLTQTVTNPPRIYSERICLPPACLDLREHCRHKEQEMGEPSFTHLPLGRPGPKRGKPTRTEWHVWNHGFEDVPFQHGVLPMNSGCSRRQRSITVEV